jgi:hypothetical protein
LAVTSELKEQERLAFVEREEISPTIGRRQAIDERMQIWREAVKQNLWQPARPWIVQRPQETMPVNAIKLLAGESEAGEGEHIVMKRWHDLMDEQFPW